jgi:acyl carrier protein
MNAGPRENRARSGGPDAGGAPIEVESRIREFISRNLLFSEDGFACGDDASFMDEGIVDSIGVLELVNFVGEHFGVSVEPDDITPENFDSVNRLARYIREKQARAAQGR